MQGSQFLRGLAATPTGPALGALLASIDPRGVSDVDLNAVLAAQARQLSYQQAQVWSVMAEMATRDPMVSLDRRWTPDEVFESAANEIRAELRMTRRSANRELENANGLVSRPRVAQALAAGAIDRTRAITLADGCLGLTDEQVDKLLDAVLPAAGQVTPTRLAEQVRKVALALDPAWAERRYKQALRERRMIGYLNDDGTATVSGQYLPAERAAAACARVDALARTAKRTGAATQIDYLRTELFLGLLDGRFQGKSESEIVDELRRQFLKAGTAAPEPEPTNSAVAAPARPDNNCAAVRGAHLRIGLGTLLGLDDQPGEIAGWGPVNAPVARTVVAQQRKAEWRFAVVDVEGRVLFDGVTRCRPRYEKDGEQASGGIVELHVPQGMLRGLGSYDAGWAGVIADIAAQYAAQLPIEQDPDARFAGRPLRRRIQIHFQRCVFAGCRRPASECDLDHRREHSRGGRTDEENQTPACRYDHELKTSHGWRMVRRDEKTFVWISPLGRRHVVPVEPVAPPLPAPVPRALPPDNWVEDDDPDPPRPIFGWVTRRGRPLPPKPVEPAPVSRAIHAALDPPPF